MMPVIPGVHQQIAYSRWRGKICISEFLAEVLKLELVDQIWGGHCYKEKGLLIKVKIN